MRTNRSVPLRQALRAAAPLPDPRPATDFWQDFRARSALTMQEAPERVAVVGARLTSWRWLAATAALLVVLASLGVFLRTGPGPSPIAQAPAPAPTNLSTVQELEVFSEYSSVMILEDVENGGTVIWVASADTGALR